MDPSHPTSPPPRTHNAAAFVCHCLPEPPLPFLGLSSLPSPSPSPARRGVKPLTGQLVVMATEPPAAAEKKKVPLPKVVTLNKALKLVSSSSPPTWLLSSFPCLTVSSSGGVRCNAFSCSLLPALGFVDVAANLIDINTITVGIQPLRLFRRCLLRIPWSPRAPNASRGIEY